MKVTGPGSQPPVGAPEEPNAPEAKAGAGFADKLDRTAGTQPAGAAAAGKAAGTLTSDIARALANKEITAEAAVDQVVSRILDKQVGPGGQPSTRAKVETALRDALETDPVLSAKIRRLAE